MLVREVKVRLVVTQLLLLVMVVSKHVTARRVADYDEARYDYVAPVEDRAVSSADYEDDTIKMEKAMAKHDDTDAWSASGINDDRSELEVDVDDIRKERKSKTKIDKYDPRYKSKEYNKKSKFRSKAKSSISIEDRGKNHPRRKNDRMDDLESDEYEEFQEVIRTTKKNRKSDKAENKKHGYKIKSSDDSDDLYDRSSDDETDVVRDAKKGKVKELDEQEMEDGIDVQDMEDINVSKDVNHEHKAKKRLSEKDDYYDHTLGTLQEYLRTPRSQQKKTKIKGQTFVVLSDGTKLTNYTDQTDDTKLIDDAKLIKIANQNWQRRLSKKNKTRRPKRPKKPKRPKRPNKIDEPTSGPAREISQLPTTKFNRSIAEELVEELLDSSVQQENTKRLPVHKKPTSTKLPRTEPKLEISGAIDEILSQDLQKSIPSHDINRRKKPKASRKRHQQSKITTIMPFMAIKPRPEPIRNVKIIKEESYTPERKDLTKVSLKESTIKKEALKKDVFKKERIKVKLPKEEPLEEKESQEEAIKEEKLTNEVEKNEISKEEVLKKNALKKEASREEVIKEDASKEETLKEEVLKEDASNTEILHEDAESEEALKEIVVNEAVLRADSYKDPEAMEAATTEVAVTEAATTEAATTEVISKQNFQSRAEYKSLRRHAREVMRQRVLNGELVIPREANDDTLICDNVDVALFDAVTILKPHFFITALSVLICLLAS